MREIYCDVCGEKYPETAACCPRCNTAKTDESKSRPVPKRSEEPVQGSSNKVLLIIVLVLLALVIAVAAFVVVRIVDMANNGGGHNPNEDQTTTSPTTQPGNIPCTGLRLPMMEITFDAINKTHLLEPILEPANTTEEVFFTSSNEKVVLVDANGLITPVADGEAKIYVTCGGYRVECTIICNMGIAQPTEPTEPTNPPTEPPAPAVLVLNRVDFTLKGYGASWNLTNRGQGYEGPDADKVIWTVDDPSVATVKNGVVTAVGNGKTTVRAQYQGVEVTCIVRCNSVVPPVETGFKLSTTDVTLKVGEQFTLRLTKDDGTPVVDGYTFAVKNVEIASVDEKGRVKGLKAGTTKVIVTYDGVEYECTIRVKEAPAEP